MKVAKDGEGHLFLKMDKSADAIAELIMKFILEKQAVTLSTS